MKIQDAIKNFEQYVKTNNKGNIYNDLLEKIKNESREKDLSKFPNIEIQKYISIEDFYEQLSFKILDTLKIK